MEDLAMKQPRLSARGQKILLLLSAFFLPLLILAAAFAALGIVPFGRRTLLISDANAYYINYLRYLSRVVSGEHSPWYSFSKGLGGDIATLFAFYGIKPSILLYLAAGDTHLPLAFSLHIMLGCSLCGLSMYLLLRRCYGAHARQLLFSTSYALMGFLCVNSFNVPYFGLGVFLLPLVALGLDRLREGEGCTLYICALAYGIGSNFQMGFVLSTAALLFFFALLYMGGEDARRGFARRFCLSSLSAGLLSALLWLPALLSMIGGRASAVRLDDFVLQADFPPLSFLSRLFLGASSTSQLIAGLPAVFVGILPLALVILFFRLPDSGRKKKQAAAALLLIYFLAFFLKTFNSIFQGFTVAYWFDYRYSFVFSFLLLLPAADAAGRIGAASERMLWEAFLLLLLPAVLCFSHTYEYTDARNAFLDMLLLGIMLGAYRFHRRDPKRAPKSALLGIVFVCVCFELYLNYYFCTGRVLDEWTQDAADFTADVLAHESVTNLVRSVDGGFYRMENEDQRAGSSGCDVMMFDYHGVGHRSYERDFVTYGASKLGVSRRGTQFNFYDPGMPAAMDAFLGLRYIISKEDLAAQKNYQKLLDSADAAVWRNPYALGIAIPAEARIMDVALSDTADIFAIQNRIWRALCDDTRDVFVKQEAYVIASHNVFDEQSYDAAQAMSLPDPKADMDGADREQQAEAVKEAYSSYIEISFTAERSGPVYLYDAASVSESYGSDADVLQYIGNYEVGDAVSRRLYPGVVVDTALLADTARGLSIYYADMELLAEYSGKINARDVRLVKENDRMLSGHISSQGGERLLFTIPYDRGWELRLDGEKLKLDETMELFMSAEIPAGEHSYVLHYHVPGLGVGATLSALGAIGLLVLLFHDRRERKTATAAFSENACNKSENIV